MKASDGLTELEVSHVEALSEDPGFVVGYLQHGPGRTGCAEAAGEGCTVSGRPPS